MIRKSFVPLNKEYLDRCEELLLITPYSTSYFCKSSINFEI